jgi:hypothetical protein
MGPTTASQRVAHCEFCGRARVTEEHFLPRWLDLVLESRTPDDIHHQQKQNASLGSEGHIWTEISKKRQGPVRTKKVRAVCRQCNQRWRGQIQDKAKPILTPLIINEERILSESDLHIVAQWMVMTVMTFEFDDRPTVAVPAFQRIQLYRSQSIPEGWKVWIGRYSGQEWKERPRHVAGKMSKDGTATSYNTQATTIVLGSLILYAFSTTESDDIEPRPDNLPNAVGLIQIWPPRDEALEWSQVAIINDAQANEIASWLEPCLSG